jgi:hypothetical protein
MATRISARALFVFSFALAWLGPYPSALAAEPLSSDIGRVDCFNVVCRYESLDSGDSRRCEATAEFSKHVGEDGDEVEDRFDDPAGTVFEVSCDRKKLDSLGARRLTDREGTRIQAEAGPHPAVLLPRGALSERHRYVESALELDDRTLHGECFVYSGPALRFAR